MPSAANGLYLYMPLTGEYEPSTSDWARKQAELYEASGGTEGVDLRGHRVIVLTSVGAKTGKGIEDHSHSRDDGPEL